ncbi:MAG: iron-containing alcohol dehydrogenase [Actinomycetota bacterium]|nr:iron-containing alcohol dehydrogenase [Actinomycetota bacterium]
MRPAHATTFLWEAAPVLYGLGATAEIGIELSRRGIRRAVIVSDANIRATGLVDEVVGWASESGVETIVWAESQLEPTDTSIAAAVDDLAGERIDGYVALGGGSCIDTCKAVSVGLADSAPLSTYVAQPHGEGRPVPRDRPPIIGMPTTSGSGAESTGAASIDFTKLGLKASIVDRALTPALAIVDPYNMVSAPPAVTASAGYDVLVQSLESYTSRAFDQVPPRPAHKAPPMVGANPISDVWGERAIALCGQHLIRAVHDGSDLEARIGMTQAAMFSRLGTAGAHLPHANAAAVSGLAPDTYVPAGFTGVDRSVIPHGQAVVSTAAEAFAFTYAGAPARHERAARLLGMTGDEAAHAGQDALSRWIRQMIKMTGGPNSLDEFGFGPSDIGPLVEMAIAQRRLLPRCPRPVTRDDLTGVFSRSMHALTHD